MSISLPSNVSNLLENGKFLHLGTASPSGVPDVALMNYLYIPEQQVVVLSTPKNSAKYANISSNRNVSLLIHDWTTTKAPLNSQSSGNGSNGGGSNLLSLLHDLNHSQLSQLSATFQGEASVVEDQEKLGYYRGLLKKENPDAAVFIEGEGNAIVIVSVTKAIVCDVDNQVTEYE